METCLSGASTSFCALKEGEADFNTWEYLAVLVEMVSTPVLFQVAAVLFSVNLAFFSEIARFCRRPVSDEFG